MRIAPFPGSELRWLLCLGRFSFEDGSEAAIRPPTRHDPWTSPTATAVRFQTITEPWSAGEALAPHELRAARLFVRRILNEVPARLVQAALFGSRARGEGRRDSDVDVLLVFRALPPDREPHAGHAEAIADEVADDTGIPVTVWSVSLVDLQRGNRTPMLVDALADALPIWCRDTPLPAVPFTRQDAVRCADALLQRVAEGSDEFRRALGRGDPHAAARRARDDLVRICTGVLLLRGVTRPRRADAIQMALTLDFPGGPIPPPVGRTLAWASRSFGPSGSDEERPLAAPPLPPPLLAEAVEQLRQRLCRSLETRHCSCTPQGSCDFVPVTDPPYGDESRSRNVPARRSVATG